MGHPAELTLATAPWRCLACIAVAVLAGCGPQTEKAAHLAEPGDLLVRTSSGKEIRLVESFRAGQPNGLYGGVVDVIDKAEGAGAGSERLNANAVCSLEDVPGWPQYDNLYGSVQAGLDEDGTEQSRWQVLLHFDGRIEETKARGLNSSPQEWAQRLRDNLCRKGDFDDRPSRDS
jgi:hypothetical protein